MAWVAVGSAVVGGVLNYAGSKKAANAQQKASQAAIDEQRREYDQTRQDQMPWLQAGTNALGMQQKALGGDWSGFQNSPDYAWALDQGLKGVDRSAAARGNLYSGGHTADVMNYAQGLASQNFGNYWNRLAGMAGQGQTAANNLGSYGMTMANNIGGYLNNIGNSQANAYNNQYNTFGQMAGVLGGALNNWWQGRGPGGTTGGIMNIPKN